MNSRIENALTRANSGELTQNELENLKSNAIRIGNAEVVVEACNQMLSAFPSVKRAKKKDPIKKTDKMTKTLPPNKYR